MSFLHPSIMYFHFSTFGKILYLQLIKHFSIRRALFTLIFLILFILLFSLVTICRLLDEIIFFGYRKTQIKEPVFIIANPRSGTTYLHRLMCDDEEKFRYTLLYHTIFPSILLIKLIEGIGKLEKPIGSPFKKFFKWIDSWAFKGWENIHPMGLAQSEEDEGMFIFPLMTPGIYLLIPFINEMDDAKFMDKMPAKTQKKLMDYYESSLKRFLYATGSDKVFLSKNVMSTGRFKALIDRFPDAKIIYLVRNPYNVIPSFISMFTAAWKAHSPDIGNDSEEARAWGELGIAYFKYFFELKKAYPESQILTIPYTELSKHPYKTVERIYSHFNMAMSENFKEQLRAKTNITRKYKSKHNYSLEQYGLKPSDIHVPLAELFEEFNFPIEA